MDEAEERDERKQSGKYRWRNSFEKENSGISLVRPTLFLLLFPGTQERDDGGQINALYGQFEAKGKSPVTVRPWIS